MSSEPMPPPILQWLLVCTLVGLSVVDSRSYRLPNRCTVTLWLAGFAWHGLAPQGAGFAWSLQGAALGMLPLFWFVLRGRMGAGDLKLMGAIGGWLGGWTALHVLVISGLAGPVLAGIQRCLLTQTRPANVSSRPPREEPTLDEVVCNPAARGRWIPFSLPITLGVILMVLFPEWRWRQPSPQHTSPTNQTRGLSP